MALALIGPEQSSGLQVNWNQWVRFGESHSRIRVELAAARTKRALDLRVVRKPFPSVVSAKRSDRSWSKPGPFAASFGPFRRFSGGDARFDELLSSGVPFSAHLSLFNESVALGSAATWLMTLRPARTRGETRAFPTHDSGWGLVGRIGALINQPGFLPSGVALEEVSHERVVFRDGRGARVEVEQLSDGYRSILSLVFELVRRAVLFAGPARAFSRDSTSIAVPGIVCIDEADAHLHPRWQREIGPWLCRLFPKIQFLVTTHSPFICQASEGASVFQLSAEGEARFVEGQELRRLQVGNVLEAYGTHAFGGLMTRSDSGLELVSELAALNARVLGGTRMTPRERNRLRELKALLPTAE
ncbi:MAG: AAA family ATPase [Myxococcaceae bacterium]|nr:AAA family ATPase [Myxococcaceae bacterium]